MRKNFFIKTNRAFTSIRRYGWLFTLLVALGGLWLPRLGLLVILIMVALTISSFFTGRYWCGNICPHGSLFDVVLMPLSKNRKIPAWLYSKAMITVFFIFFMFNFMRKILNVVSLWGSIAFLDRLGFVFVTTYLMVLIVGGLLAIFLNPRSWCQFCPMGTLQKMFYKIGNKFGITRKTEPKVTINNTELCRSCGKCARVCPFQLTPYLEFNDNNQFDHMNCIKCATCIENCPAKILSFATETQAKNDLPGHKGKSHNSKQVLA